MNQFKSKATWGTYLHLHFIVFIWGFTAILGKLITIPSVEIVFYRTLFSALGLLIILKIKHIDFSVSTRQFWQIIGTGMLIAMHWILFFLAAQVSNVSICLAGMATVSFWTSFIDPIVNKRPVKWYEIAVALISVLGIVVVFQSTFDHVLGFGIAVASALIAAIFTVINGKLVQHQNHFTITFYEMLGAFAIVVLFLPIYSQTFVEGGLHFMLSTMDFIYLMVLALVCTVYAYSASVEMMHRLSAFVINLTVNLEPVYGILMAVLLFGGTEAMDFNFYLGTFIILLSVLAYPILRKLIEGRNIKQDLRR